MKCMCIYKRLLSVSNFIYEARLFGKTINNIITKKKMRGRKKKKQMNECLQILIEESGKKEKMRLNAALK